MTKKQIAEKVKDDDFDNAEKKRKVETTENDDTKKDGNVDEGVGKEENPLKIPMTEAMRAAKRERMKKKREEKKKAKQAARMASTMKKKSMNDSAAADLDDQSDDNEEKPVDATKNVKNEVYLPNMPLGEDEELVCDPSAYRLHHSLQTGYPCLCFDVIPDAAANSDSKTDFDCYVVAGTQAENPTANKIIVMKLSELHVKNAESDDDGDSESDESGWQCFNIKSLILQLFSYYFI